MGDPSDGLGAAVLRRQVLVERISMTSPRTLIPTEVAADVLFACDRTCCVCEVRGKPIQIHHLDGDPSNHLPENLAVLCLECHNETQLRGGFGRQLTPEVVIKYRDRLIKRVAERKHKIDQRFVELAVRNPIKAVDHDFWGTTTGLEGLPARGALSYIWGLPDIRTGLLEIAQSERYSGSTVGMMEASYDYIDALASILINLGSYYSGKHSWRKHQQRLLSEQIAARFEWHRSHVEPNGPGTGGTIVNIIICRNVQEDVEKMVENMVVSLVGYNDEFGWEEWKGLWRAKP